MTSSQANLQQKRHNNWPCKAGQKPFCPSSPKPKGPIFPQAPHQTPLNILNQEPPETKADAVMAGHAATPKVSVQIAFRLHSGGVVSSTDGRRSGQRMRDGRTGGRLEL